MIKVGVVGCGTIGKELSLACLRKFKEEVTLFALTDADPSRARKLQKKLKPRPKVLTVEEIIRGCDLIIEAASTAAAYDVAKRALSLGKDVLVMSVGGLLGHEKEVMKLARTHRCCLYLPSGGVVGIDGLKAAGIGKIHRVTLTTRKPPQSYEDAPYILKHRINLKSVLKEEKVLFEGNASAAVKGFPKNINVSATLSLAGIGAKRTQVRILASPQMLVNVHEVYVVGDFGSFYTRTENFPSEQNPKTSRLAILSAVATLERILKNVKIGT